MHKSRGVMWLNIIIFGAVRLLYYLFVAGSNVQLRPDGLAESTEQSCKPSSGLPPKSCLPFTFTRFITAT